MGQPYQPLKQCLKNLNNGSAIELQEDKDHNMSVDRVVNNCPPLVKQNIILIITGIILISVALSFHQETLRDEDPLGLYSSLSTYQDEEKSEKFRHQIIYNYQDFKPQPNSNRRGFVNFAYHPKSKTWGAAAINNKKLDPSSNLKQDLIFFREVVPENYEAGKKPDILLLHGAAFTSLTWESIQTLQILKENGFRAVAVDLPSYGESPKAVQIPPLESALFLRSLHETFNMKSFVLVSPSMSGRFAIPYIFSPQRTNDYKLKGWVPVAPVGIRDHTENEYGTLDKLPSWVVYGEKDSAGRSQSLQYLSKIPNSKILGMKDAEHPCYMTDPDAWNNGLIEYLNNNF